LASWALSFGPAEYFALMCFAFACIAGLMGDAPVKAGLAAIIGPLSYGAITWMAGGNQRVAILSTAALFMAGLVLLVKVDMARGRAAALAAGPQATQ
ncbi:MAG: tripartite tricarboxylate transporter permease, partial [Ramlibacter sp.]